MRGLVVRVEVGVSEPGLERAGQVELRRQFDAACAGLPDVFHRAGKCGEIERDEVVEIRLEPRRAERAAIAGEVIVGAGVPAAGLLGPEVGVADVERALPVEIEETRRAETRPVARAEFQPRVAREPRRGHAAGRRPTEGVEIVAAQPGRQVEPLDGRPFVLHKEREKLLPPVDVAETGVARRVQLAREAAGQPVLRICHVGALPVEHDATVLDDRHLMTERPGVIRNEPPVLPAEHDMAREVRPMREIGEDRRKLVALAILVVRIVSVAVAGVAEAGEETAPRRTHRHVVRDLPVEPQ